MRYGGVLLVLLAAILWGITGGIADILMNKGWNPIVISFYRGAVGLASIMVWFLLSTKKKTWAFSPYLFRWSILAGIGVAGNFTFYFLSIEASSIPIAATLMYTAPVFVLLVSFFLNIERSSWFKWGCILFVLIGIVLLTGVYNSGSSAASPAGIVMGLLSGISYAVFIFGFKKSAAYGKPDSTLAIALFIFCMLMLFFIDHQEAVSVFHSSDLGWFILLGLVGAGMSFLIYVIGIKWTAPSTASMIAMIEPVTASLFGILVLENQLTVIQTLGMVLILVTITSLSVKQA